MDKAINEGFAKWVEKHIVYNKPLDEAAFRYILKIAENATYSDEMVKERFIQSIKEYAQAIGVDLNG